MDETIKIKSLQNQNIISRLETLDYNLKDSKSKLGSSAASKIVSKLSPKSVHRKKRRIAKFKAYKFILILNLEYFNNVFHVKVIAIYNSAVDLSK